MFYLCLDEAVLAWVTSSKMVWVNHYNNTNKIVYFRHTIYNTLQVSYNIVVHTLK